MIDFNKTFLIFGTGSTGSASISFCLNNKIKFFITDDNKENLQNLIVNNRKIDESYKLYEYNEQVLKNKHIEYILLSPSIHAQVNPHKIVQLANKLNIKIIPDIDLFYNYVQKYNREHNCSKKLIGITGTNGKSTTTALMTHLLLQFDKKAIACGNIGVNTLSIDVEQYDFFVVEMSSYNLYLMQDTIFDYSILLNITEDHIEYHGTMQNYVLAKEKIVKHSKKTIICIDDDYTKTIEQKNRQTKDIIKVSTQNILETGYSWLNNSYYSNNNIIYKCIFNNLLGKHNVENILCSVVCVFYILNNTNININIQNIFELVKSFNGLEHRIQFVKNINGIDFYNDSKGTNANSTQVALQSFEQRPIYLIAGGKRKTMGFNFLRNDLKYVKCVFLIGEATESFSVELQQVGKKYIKCNTMKNAVNTAYNTIMQDFQWNIKAITQQKPVVLLSPLCASFDQYTSFEERGKDFCTTINNLLQ